MNRFRNFAPQAADDLDDAVGRLLEQYHHEWRQPGDKIAR